MYRTATARGKAEQADIAAVHGKQDSDVARVFAKQFAPEFTPGGKKVFRMNMRWSPAAKFCYKYLHEY